MNSKVVVNELLGKILVRKINGKEFRIKIGGKFRRGFSNDLNETTRFYIKGNKWVSRK